MAASTPRTAHRALVERVVEVDGDFLDRNLNDGEVPATELHAPLQQALHEAHLIPVCFVSARSGAGVAELLDIIVKLWLNPLEANAADFLHGKGPDALPMHATSYPARHVLAHVFKVTVDLLCRPHGRDARAPGHGGPGRPAGRTPAPSPGRVPASHR
mgnify:FL=1